MSVGGIIIDIVKVDPHKWWINTIDKADLMSAKPMDRACAIYVDPGDYEPDIADSLWWQGDKAYWTPTSRTRVDIPLARIGFSGVPHPDLPRCPHCGCTLAFCEKYGGCDTGAVVAPRDAKERP